MQIDQNHLVIFVMVGFCWVLNLPKLLFVVVRVPFLPLLSIVVTYSLQTKR